MRLLREGRGGGAGLEKAGAEGKEQEHGGQEGAWAEHGVHTHTGGLPEEKATQETQKERPVRKEGPEKQRRTLQGAGKTLLWLC